jgi:hypothetical protein
LTLPSQTGDIGTGHLHQAISGTEQRNDGLPIEWTVGKASIMIGPDRQYPNQRACMGDIAWVNFIGIISNIPWGESTPVVRFEQIWIDTSR